MTSMRLAYGDSNVLKCNIQFAYDRFFTSFTDRDGGVPVNTELGLIDDNLIDMPDVAMINNRGRVTGYEEYDRKDYGGVR